MGGRTGVVEACGEGGHDESVYHAGHVAHVDEPLAVRAGVDVCAVDIVGPDTGHSNKLGTHGRRDGHEDQD